MKRFLGFAVAMFFALVAIALVGGDAGAVAGHGCHGARRCHGGLFAHKKRCHGERGGLFGKHRRCHGEAAPVASESACGDCGAAAEGCGACGEGAVVEGGYGEGGCGACAEGAVVEGGCAGGACGGEGVISEGVPTEAAPAAPAAPEAPAAPAKT
jgi:hypothetical protein